MARLADEWRFLTTPETATASRWIQQPQNPATARMNNLARANRIMLTDISGVLTFIKR